MCCRLLEKKFGKSHNISEELETQLKESKKNVCEKKKCRKKYLKEINNFQEGNENIQRDIIKLKNN